MRVQLIFILLSGSVPGVANSEFSIHEAHNSAAEAETEKTLRIVLGKYDLRKWTFTTTIRIEEGVIPHSHPVLTIGTRDQDEVSLLAEFIHEQAHWFENSHPNEIRQAVAQLRVMYPKLPISPPDGANGNFSTYMHLIVCYWELEGLSETVGEEMARRTLARTASHHYRSVYRIVLDDTASVQEVIVTQGLVVPESRR